MKLLDGKNRQNKRVFHLVAKLLRSEEGQATTEYVMLMAVLVVALIAVGKIFRDNMLSLINSIGQRIRSEMFSSSRIHQLPPGLRPR